MASWPHLGSGPTLMPTSSYTLRHRHISSSRLLFYSINPLAMFRVRPSVITGRRWYWLRQSGNFLLPQGGAAKEGVVHQVVGRLSSALVVIICVVWPQRGAWILTLRVYWC